MITGIYDFIVSIAINHKTLENKVLSFNSQ